MAEDTAPLMTSNEGLGSIRVADEVVSVIAGLAAMDVDGVAGMSGGLIGGIAEMLGRRNFSKGVKVEVGEQEAAVDLSIVVTYGVDIRRAEERASRHRVHDWSQGRRNERTGAGRRLPRRGEGRACRTRALKKKLHEAGAPWSFSRKRAILKEL